MKTKVFKIIFLVLVSIPFFANAQVVSVDKIKVDVKAKQDNEYQLDIKFDLPELPRNTHIDYAVLNMGVNVLSNLDSATMVFEILTKENSGREKIRDYNANPVTTIISRNTKGFTQLVLDITQLVKLWVQEGEKNEGITLVSHRNVEKKFLKTDKINFNQDLAEPTLRIFYTVLD